MWYQRVGASGLMVSAVGFGCIEFGRSAGLDTARKMVDSALDLGINLFDTAASYGDGESERLLGKALDGRRSDVVISTKFGSRRQRPVDNAVGSRRYVRTAVEGALRRLGTDYIDLFQLHFPDPGTPIAETVGALDELAREGKIRYAGCSNFSAWQLVEAAWAARVGALQGFVSVQRQYALLDLAVERDIVPVCDRYGIGLFAWRPLALGLLSGSVKRGDAFPTKIASKYGDADFDTIDRLRSFARDRGVGLVDVALGGLLSFPAVTCVLVGTSSVEHLAADVAAAGWVPTSSDVAALRGILVS